MKVLTRWGVSGLVVLAPLLAGGTHLRVAVVLGAFVLVLAIGVAWRKSRVRVSGATWAFLALALVCSIQLIPVPEALHRFLNPAGWEMYRDGWEVMFGASPEHWRPVSLDPAATAHRGILWLTVGLAAFTASNHANERHATARVQWTIVVTGGIVLAVGAIQELFDAKAVLFLLPIQGEIVPFTTFVSANHAAVLCLFGAFCAASRCLDSDVRPAGAMLGIVAAAGLMGASFQFESLGTVIAFGLAMAGFGYLQAWHFDREVFRDIQFVRKVAMWGMIAAGLGVVAVGVVWFVNPRFLEGYLFVDWLEQRSATRLELVKSASAAIPDFWRFGAGGDAVEPMLAPYIDWQSIRPATIPTVENEIFDWLLEYGIVGVIGLVAIAAPLISAGYRYLARPRTRYAFGAAATLFLICIVQFHFPFRALGVAIPLVVAIETALFPVRRSESSGSEGLKGFVSRGLVRLDGRGKFLLMVSVTGLGAALTFGWGAYDRQLDGRLDASEASDVELANQVWLTPSDGDPYVSGAGAAFRADRPAEALERMEYAFGREPKANIALKRARLLIENGKNDAAVEQFASVFGGDYKRVPTQWLKGYLIVVVDDTDLLAEILGRVTYEYREHIPQLMRDRRPAFVAQVGLAMVSEFPDQKLPYVLLAQGYMRMGQYALAEMWAERLMELDGTHGAAKQRAGYFWLARIANESGNGDQALTYLTDGILAFPDDRRLARELMRRRPRESSNAGEETVEAVETATQQLCRSEEGWTQRPCWLGEGWLAERRGDLTSARYAYERIAERKSQPRALIHFHARHGNCQKLHQLVDGLSEPDRDRLGQSRIERLRRMCGERAAGLEGQRDD